MTTQSAELEICQNAVEEMRNQSSKLEYSETRLRFYREVIRELAQKYIQFLNADQSEAVLKCQNILGQWDGLTLPSQPSLTDVAKAVRYSLLKEGNVNRRRKHGVRQNKNKQCTAQARERAFFDCVTKSVQQWQEEAEAKCTLVDEIDSYIDKLHSIVSMLDSRFHHNLERFFIDGVAARRSVSSSSMSGKSRKNRKANKNPDDLMRPRVVVPIKLIIEDDEDDPSEELCVAYGKGMNVDVEVFIVNKDRGVQTDDVNDEDFEDIDPSIPLFEVSDYECEEVKVYGKKKAKCLPRFGDSKKY